jgi:hypothetical protein
MSKVSRGSHQHHQRFEDPEDEERFADHPSGDDDSDLERRVRERFGTFQPFFASSDSNERAQFTPDPPVQGRSKLLSLLKEEPVIEQVIPTPATTTVVTPKVTATTTTATTTATSTTTTVPTVLPAPSSDVAIAPSVLALFAAVQPQQKQQQQQQHVQRPTVLPQPDTAALQQRPNVAQHHAGRPISLNELFATASASSTPPPPQPAAPATGLERWFPGLQVSSSPGMQVAPPGHVLSLEELEK